MNIPFQQQSPLPLLGLDGDDENVDEDFAGFGWGVLESVQLVAANGTRETIDRALVLALHTPDDAEPGSLDLEFWVDGEHGEELAVQMPWEHFAATILRPLLRSHHRDVVLALCNPHGERPTSLDGRRLHWAEGDVTSWLDPDGSIRLQATSWSVR